MAHVFMTGGTGFVGSQIIKRLAADGHRITALARSHSRIAELIEQTNHEESGLLSAVIGDLTKQGLGLSSSDRLAIQNVDVIIHAGGPMDILLTEQQAKRVFLDAANHLTSLAAELYENGNPLHFIHVVGFKSPVTDSNLNDATAIMQLLEHEAPYERMKINADVHIRQHAKQTGYPLSVVNPSVVIGDSTTGNTEQTGGLGILIAAARKKLMGTVPGGKKHWLPLVHLDHTAAFIAALANEQQPLSNTYYLLDEQAASLNMSQLITLINKELRVPSPIGFIPVSLLSKILSSRMGSKLGIPQESLSFIVNQAFPLQSTQHIQQKYSLPATVDLSVLPHVIADLDYRLSHRPTSHPNFVRSKRGPLATLEKTGSGNPIILLPGTFSGADCLIPLASELRHRQIWIADLPGFGRSPYHHHPVNVVNGHVEAIMSAITSQPETVTLIGHSYGALLAAKVMERMPERIQAVHLLQPALHHANSRYRSRIVNRMLLPHISLATLRKELVLQGCFERIGQIPKDYLEYVLNELSSPRVRATLADTLAQLTKDEHFRQQPEQWGEKRVSIIWGSQDRVYTIPKTYSAVPTQLLARGHHFPLSHPSETARLLFQAGL
ncbi:alpha/beta fold hydrolase [Paenibacillus sp. NRS-1760]|uniref:alpha/beta fold hydrolase n=1 Tax=Paenibacillus sp. NRS-1760 TaxID=3233902 RepID=UPI003D26FFE3